MTLTTRTLLYKRDFETSCPKHSLPPYPGRLFSWPGFIPGEKEYNMAFFASAVDTLQTLVIALGAGLGVWGVVNLLEGYGSDNRATRS